jgi:hypothetical protein
MLRHQADKRNNPAPRSFLINRPCYANQIQIELTSYDWNWGRHRPEGVRGYLRPVWRAVRQLRMFLCGGCGAYFSLSHKAVRGQIGDPWAAPRFPDS